MKYNLKKSLNRSTADDSDVHVKISDTGVGIAPEDLNNIFTPVYSTDKTNFYKIRMLK